MSPNFRVKVGGVSDFETTMHLVFLWLILRPFDSPLLFILSRSCWRPSAVVAIKTMSSAYLILLIMTTFMKTATGTSSSYHRKTDSRTDWTSMGMQCIFDELLVWSRPSLLVLWGDAQLLSDEHKRCGEYADLCRRLGLLVVNWAVLHVWPYGKPFCSMHKIDNMNACAFSEQTKKRRKGICERKQSVRISMKLIETQSMNVVSK